MCSRSAAGTSCRSTTACLDEGIAVIDVRHEQSAAHAADGWARVTGQPGVAIVNRRPRAHRRGDRRGDGLAREHPMVCIGGQAPRAFQDMGGLQDMAHVDLMRPITKWSVAVPSSKRLGDIRRDGVPRRDHQRARARLPGDALDFLFDMVDEADISEWNNSRTTRAWAPIPRFVGKAFISSRGAQRPVCLVGFPALLVQATRRVPEFVKTFGMPVYVNGQARRQPRSRRSALVPQTRKDALKKADVVLIFGTPLDSDRHGRDRSSTPRRSSSRWISTAASSAGTVCDVGIIGDTGMVMAELTQSRGREVAPELSKAWLSELVGSRSRSGG